MGYHLLVLLRSMFNKNGYVWKMDLRLLDGNVKIIKLCYPCNVHGSNNWYVLPNTQIDFSHSIQQSIPAHLLPINQDLWSNRPLQLMCSIYCFFYYSTDGPPNAGFRDGFGGRSDIWSSMLISLNSVSPEGFYLAFSIRSTLIFNLYVQTMTSM